MDAREQLDVLAEHLRERARRGFAAAAVLLGEQVQRGFERQLAFAFGVEGEARHGLVKELVPGGGAHGGLVVQKLFQLIRQLVGAHRAHPLEHRLVAGKVGIGGDQPVKGLIREPVEFECEKDKRIGVIGHFFLQVLQELCSFAVQRVLVVAQPGIAHQAPADGFDLFEGLDAFEQARAVKPGQFALVLLGERLAGGLDAGKVARHLGGIRRGVEIGQVPIGQRAERIRPPGGGIGITNGNGQDGRAHGVSFSVSDPDIGRVRAGLNPPDRRRCGLCPIA